MSPNPAISNAMRAVWADPVRRAARVANMQQAPRAPGSVAALKITQSPEFWTPERRKAHSAVIKERHRARLGYIVPPEHRRWFAKLKRAGFSDADARAAVRQHAESL